MLEAAYQSAWQQPGIAFVGAVPVLVLALLGSTRRRAFTILFVALELEILLDAWLTGPLSPLSAPHVTLAVSLFIVLGDLRWFYLVERQLHASRERAWLSAISLSLVLPFCVGLAHELAPARFSGTLFFLVYEALFVGWALVIARVKLARLDGDRARYVRRLTALVVAQYALWATADALILLHHDVGWLLRLVPNALYYVAFVPVATMRVPDDVRA
ncbi:MAG: hypothetical protein ABI321_05540 [Polyangia bacterium]